MPPLSELSPEEYGVGLGTAASFLMHLRGLPTPHLVQPPGGQQAPDPSRDPQSQMGVKPGHPRDRVGTPAPCRFQETLRGRRGTKELADDMPGASLVGIPKGVPPHRHLVTPLQDTGPPGTTTAPGRGVIPALGLLCGAPAQKGVGAPRDRTTGRVRRWWLECMSAGLRVGRGGIQQGKLPINDPSHRRQGTKLI